MDKNAERLSMLLDMPMGKTKKKAATKKTKMPAKKKGKKC